jgi:hypothetical protein
MQLSTACFIFGEWTDMYSYENTFYQNLDTCSGLAFILKTTIPSCVGVKVADDRLYLV